MGHYRYGGGGTTQALPGRMVLSLVAVVLLCGAASFVNPYGVALVRYPWQQTTRSLARAISPDWFAMHRLYYYTPLFAAYSGCLALLWLGWLRVHGPQRQRSRQLLLWVTGGLFVGIALLQAVPPVTGWLTAGWSYAAWVEASTVIAPHQSLLAALLWGLLAVWTGCTVMQWRTVDVTQSLWVLLCVGMSFHLSRLMPNAVIGIAPILAGTVTTWLQSGEACSPHATMGASARRGVSRGPCGVYRTLGVSARVAGRIREARPSPLGWGVATHHLPVCAMDFVVREHLTGRVFLADDSVSYLLFRSAPQGITVNVDVRDNLFTDHDLSQDIWPALETPGGLRAHVERWDTDFVMLRPWKFMRGIT